MEIIIMVYEMKLENGQSYSYNAFTENFSEKYGDNSFCALSSIIKIKNNGGEYKCYFRPVHYPMLCSDKSLTIQLNEEYNICPRKIIKIGDKSYSNYVRYLFCLNYILIYIGTIIWKDLFNYVDEKSISKDPLYNYKNKNDITSQIISFIRTENKLN